MAGQRTGPARGFVDGLLSSSAWSFAGILLFALLELAASVALLTPRRMVSLPPALLMKNARDDYARITILSYRLKYRTRAPLTVVYLGASTAQRALFDGLAPAPIEARLRKKVGERVDFYPLFASGETVEETALLVHQLPKGFRGVVAMVSPRTRISRTG